MPDDTSLNRTTLERAVGAVDPAWSLREHERVTGGYLPVHLLELATPGGPKRAVLNATRTARRTASMSRPVSCDSSASGRRSRCPRCTVPSTSTTPFQHPSSSRRTRRASWPSGTNSTGSPTVGSNGSRGPPGGTSPNSTNSTRSTRTATWSGARTTGPAAGAPGFGRHPHHSGPDREVATAGSLLGRRQSR